MAIDHNGPDAPYAGPAENTPREENGHGSGLENTKSEPKQGVGEAWSEKRPEDWNPPPGNPGSDQDAQAPRDDGTARTKAEEGGSASGMKDVEANNSVSSEHPEPR